MIFFGGIKWQIEAAIEKIKMFERKGYSFELKRVVPPRSNRQNRYLHLILSMVAFEIGERLELVKQYIFKELVNPQIFIVEKEVANIGKAKYIKSTADLDTKEMTIAIDRFRDFASQTLEMFIPPPDDKEFMEWANRECKNNWERVI
jgi:hypothetical protein